MHSLRRKFIELRGARLDKFYFSTGFIIISTPPSLSLWSERNCTTTRGQKKKEAGQPRRLQPCNTHPNPVHNPSTIVIAARRGARVDCFRISAPGLPKFFAHHDDMNLTSFQLFNRSTVRKDSNNTVASAQQRQQHERWGEGVKKTTMHTHTFT